LMGNGDRKQQIFRLIQSLCAAGITSSSPGPLAGGPATAVGGGSPSSGPGPTGISSSSWDTYTQRPAHIDRSEVEKLFGLLTQKPPSWERDS
jgi:hypothetical protein